MKSNWFLRMLALVDNGIDLALVMAIMLVLVLFCCTLTQTHGLENVKNVLMPLGHG